MKRDNRRAIAAALHAVDELALSQQPLCPCHRPLPKPIPDHVTKLIDKARTALADEGESRLDYMDVD